MQSIKLFKKTNQFLYPLHSQSSILQFNLKSDLSIAVSKAEKVVGYPTSFLNLRWLLTDEFANMALYFRKLITTDHPLIETARKLFIGNDIPTCGLVVLLISKAFGLNSEFNDKEKDSVSGVLHSQRALAEVTEMIRTSNLIHRTIVNKGDINEKVDLNLGNKISLLSGDYLLAKCYTDLAYLRNQQLNELMYSTVRDMVDADFMGLRDERDQPYPSKPLQDQKDINIIDNFDNEPYKVQEVLGYPVAEWTLRTILAGGTLLGKSCQGALYLAKHSKDMQNVGYCFGKSIALAWEAKLQREAFVANTVDSFSLVSAPVMLHLRFDPKMYEKIIIHKKDLRNVNYDELRDIIQKGPALKNTKKLQDEYLLKAMNLLKQLPPSDARSALESIIFTMLNEKFSFDLL